MFRVEIEGGHMVLAIFAANENALYKDIAVIKWNLNCPVWSKKGQDNI